MTGAPQEPTFPPRGPVASESHARIALGIFGTRVVLLSIGIATSVLLARTLGPQGRGEYAVIVAMVGIAVVLGHSSVEQAQVYLVSRRVNMRALAANAVAFGFLVGAAVAGATAIVAASFAFPYAGVLRQPDLPIALLAIPASLIVLWSNGLLVLAGRIRVLNRAMLLSGVVQVAMLLGFAVSGRLTVTVVLICWTVNAAVPLVLTLPALRPRREDVSVRLARETFAFGLRYHPAMLGLHLLLRVDVLILAAMTDDRSVGLYALAVSLIELTNVATDSVSTAVLRHQTLIPLHESGRFTLRVVGVSAVLAVLMSAGLLVVAPTLVPIIFGEEFRGSLPAVFALAPGVVAIAMARSASSYLLRLNRPLVNSALALSALALNVVLNLLLIPMWGIAGCGVASSIAYVVLAGSNLIWLRRTMALAPTAG